jgi:hypothetical protein
MPDSSWLGLQARVAGCTLLAVACFGAAMPGAEAPSRPLSTSPPAQCIIFDDPADLYRRNAEVFSGTVTAVEPTGIKDAAHMPVQIATVRVREQWKGVTASTIRLSTTDWLFEVGASYLIFSGGEPLSTSLACRATEKLDTAAAIAKRNWLSSLPVREVGDPSPALKAEWGTVLSAEAAGPFFVETLCNRPGAGSRESAWTPDAGTLVRLEIALARELKTALAGLTSRSTRRATATDYYRQYAGFIANGRKRVYINGFHQDFVKLMGEWGPRLNRPTSWRTTAQLVCDGGSHFFGAVYDVEAGTIGGLTFHSQ